MFEQQHDTKRNEERTTNCLRRPVCTSKRSCPHPTLICLPPLKRIFADWVENVGVFSRREALEKAAAAATDDDEDASAVAAASKEAQEQPASAVEVHTLIVNVSYGSTTAVPRMHAERLLLKLLFAYMEGVCEYSEFAILALPTPPPLPEHPSERPASVVVEVCMRQAILIPHALKKMYSVCMYHMLTQMIFMLLHHA